MLDDYNSNRLIYNRKLAVKVCPYCGDTELVFVCYYKRFFGLAIICYLFQIIFCGLIGFAVFDALINLGNARYALTAPIIVVGSITLILKLWLFFLESRTHVKIICRGCGYSWIVKDTL